MRSQREKNLLEDTLKIDKEAGKSFLVYGEGLDENKTYYYFYYYYYSTFESRRVYLLENT